MKRFVRYLAAVCALMVATCLTGCRVETPKPQEIPEAGASNLTLLTSFYPLYALTLPLIDEVPDVAVKNLTQPQDGCLRDYALSVWDAAILASADFFIMGGRGLESFADALGADVANVSVLENLTLMRDGATAAQGDDEANHFALENPWLWLSVPGAKQISAAIAGALSKADPGNSDLYAKNLARAEARLDGLLSDMERALIGHTVRGVGVLHEGVEYLARDLGVDVLAVYAREPGTEMEADALAEATKIFKEAGVDILLIEAHAPQRTREDLVRAGFKLVLIDTLTGHAASDPELYESVMRKNAEALASAFDD